MYFMLSTKPMEGMVRRDWLRPGWSVVTQWNWPVAAFSMTGRELWNGFDG